MLLKIQGELSVELPSLFRNPNILFGKKVEKNKAIDRYQKNWRAIVTTPKELLKARQNIFFSLKAIYLFLKT